MCCPKATSGSSPWFPRRLSEVHWEKDSGEAGGERYLRVFRFLMLWTMLRVLG